MVLARADPRRRAWAVPCFALRGGACTSAFLEGLLATARPGRDGAAVRRASSARGPMGQARQRHKPSALPVGSGLRTTRSVAERKSRPATRRDRVRQEPGLNDRHARAKHLALSQLARLRAAPGGHAARASSRRCPPLDACATAPGGSLLSSQKPTPCCIQELPRRGAGAARLSSKLEAHALIPRRHSEAPRCPAASRDLTREPTPWSPPRSSATGSRPTSTC